LGRGSTPIRYIAQPPFPKMSIPAGDWGFGPPFYTSLWAHLTHHPKRHLNLNVTFFQNTWSLINGQTDGQTERTHGIRPVPTDHYNAESNRATRPNNNNNNKTSLPFRRRGRSLISSQPPCKDLCESRCRLVTCGGRYVDVFTLPTSIAAHTRR